MIQKSSDGAWQSKNSVKKGAVGESIVRGILESKGWTVYQPMTDGAHCFDMLSIRDKRTAIALDVKAKARFNKWPATGVDLKHFNEYMRFSQKHNMPFWIVFVDEQMLSIYGETLNELEKLRTVDGKNYPFNLSTQKAVIRVWPISAMRPIAKLDEVQARDLSEFNQRSYEFTPA